MAQWHIGIIGGSGLYHPGTLDEAQEHTLESPFGQPSGPITSGRIGGVRFSFIARHGAGHRLSPSAINYRANIDALKRCGVTDLLAISAIGSLREEIAPGQFVLADQFIDRTQSRDRTFFDGSIVAHVGLADPVCSRLSDWVGQAARQAGAMVHDRGCYVAIEGPQFSTGAESRMFRSWGGDVIGMTAMPEARLAREAELPYALLGMVTDYDGWREGEEPVAVPEILRIMRANAETARAVLVRLAALLPSVRNISPIDSALEGAIITPRTQWDAADFQRIHGVAGRVLK
ncbi:S-methyl-5'-thioadenosine phosphorylase [Altererythrobacter xixiisoli]|uniref:S-methyl-5'-thioadenosine phosphorylase n=1 Tax=Croceibacterium xixiisoli TaxID=1476466 RepID=A0A6I4TSP2_9SPHN|nr:S-methyl-5'-thioadenosine phosphorylase [Croceibacterium xixiisoli]MXO98141.1 S-methyl-5'-thioadenosine phosphorylase [Croceibacterium xixiisoli]